jgi:hypothetical protein
MDLLNPEIWKTALVQDWMTILVVWILLFIVFFWGGSILVRRWRRFTTSRRARLQFVTYERGTFWTNEPLRSKEIAQVRGVWHATNASAKKVMLKHFRLRGVTTDHHLLSVSGSDNSDRFLLPHEKHDVEIYCVMNRTAARRPRLFRADVCFVDSDGYKHWVRRVPFTYRTSSA